VYKPEQKEGGFIMEKKLKPLDGYKAAARVSYALCYPKLGGKLIMADNTSKPMDGCKAAARVAYALCNLKRQEKVS
jgi:hypothetical protein